MHDAKGQPISKGDIVMIPCRVQSALANEELCNVTVETLASMPPNVGSRHTLTLNTKMLLRGNPGDDINIHGVDLGEYWGPTTPNIGPATISDYDGPIPEPTPQPSETPQDAEPQPA